ncbi:MGMT family protein [Spectribacter hydrogenooxidans]|uniref:MGMT family protein n=1 Tax=Spectribacter hydrogenoxidans TaxID=3075608 RepID=A0ABU3C090_9GAMM|nr:MGMT family protein [Salinisphaera sp. W335]MDT0634943.1 MGMT family protein [Salinisphaera sp. W335]
MAAGDTRQRLLAVVRRVPAGRVATYGQIAKLAGLPGQARLVGYALHNCPADVPWHRIVNARGRISLPADSTAGLAQHRRLSEEGIAMIGGRIDLPRYRWEPPSEVAGQADTGG